jgi:transglutaminase-like putative cysteine protease
MIYRVVHTTVFSYEAPVSLCHNEARLLPRQLAAQECLESSLMIDPPPADYDERLDFFGNRVAWFSIQQQHDALTVTATSRVRMIPRSNLFESGNGQPWEQVRERLQNETQPELLDARQYLLDSPMVLVNDGLRDYARSSFPAGRPFSEAVHDLMQRIYTDFTYDPEFSTIATPLDEVLEHRSGVCQDFAHLAIGCLRAQGLAARYVSGYIETFPPKGKEKLVGSDASHAWFSVFVPDAGWLDFDPTNNQLPRDQHITVAWGRDFSDVSPLKGVLSGGGEHDLKVAVDVQKIED